jgi:tRNA/tmRNA/rRNA uracil-C5-methylase (TrmA/RlmC/RlmD family)
VAHHNSKTAHRRAAKQTAPVRPPHDEKVTSFTATLMTKAFPKKPHQDLPLEPFAAMAYSAELSLKQEALDMFWRAYRLDPKPPPILASPQPRHYRTTTKRRVSVYHKNIILSAQSAKNATPAQQRRSLLEPQSHGHIYQFLEEKLNGTAYRQLAEHLNAVMIRGYHEELSVIFNIDLLNAELTRKLKLLAEHLQTLPQKIVSAFVFQDGSRSSYSFEQRRPAVRVPFKRLFGKERLYLNILGKTWCYHPTAFSQVSEAMLPILLSTAENMLCPFASRLLDLYCGYGLFGLFLSERYNEIVGYDAEGVAIQSAKENAAHLRTKSKIAFYAGRITGEMLVQRLPPVHQSEHILLDPPRQGVEDKVIEVLAARRPERVLHIFCGVDEIPHELKAWKKCGYVPVGVQALDMFAGTPHLEIMILLSRKKRDDYFCT